MNIQIKYFEKFEEKERFINQYFKSIGAGLFIKALDEFSRKSGFGREPFSNIFHNEYQEWEDGYFGDSGVKFVAFYPALNLEEQAILSNSEFYELLCKESKKLTDINLEQQSLICEKLEEIKKVLEI